MELAYVEDMAIIALILIFAQTAQFQLGDVELYVNDSILIFSLVCQGPI
jgi:uncharacterized membrane protein